MQHLLGAINLYIECQKISCLDLIAFKIVSNQLKLIDLIQIKLVDETNFKINASY